MCIRDRNSAAIRQQIACRNGPTLLHPLRRASRSHLAGCLTDNAQGVRTPCPVLARSSPLAMQLAASNARCDKAVVLSHPTTKHGENACPVRKPSNACCPGGQSLGDKLEPGTGARQPRQDAYIVSLEQTVPTWGRVSNEGTRSWQRFLENKSSRMRRCV